MNDKLTPELHELAYGYRDFEAETTFAEYCWQQYTKTESNRVLDIGCRAGAHMRQFLLRGYECDGIDISQEMIDYTKARFKEEGLEFVGWQADMRRFEVKRKYGLAINMLATVNYLQKNDEMKEHLRSVWHALEPGGIYLIEMFHPREYGFPSDSPYNAWEIFDEDCSVVCELHVDPSPLDPITQCQSSTMRIAITRGDKVEEYKITRKQRVYLYQELRSLIGWVGGFEMVACYGGFNPERPLDNSKRSWRMVPVLRRLEGDE